MLSRRAFLASLASVPLIGRVHLFTNGGNLATPSKLMTMDGEFVIDYEQMAVFRHKMTEFVLSPYQTGNWPSTTFTASQSE